ncbi:MAG: hypothetical protein ABJC24_02885 [Chloroflexota bacterium]
MSVPSINVSRASAPRLPIHRHRPRRLNLLAIPGLLVLLLWASAGSAAARGVPASELADSRPGADKPPRSQPIGYDISYPQCGGPFPKAIAFGIVGVNRGIVYSPNPCLGSGSGPSELAWAGLNAELYANTGNPGPALSSRWPIGQTVPRVCAANNPDSADCAYDYGWNAAADSYATAVRAYISLGWAQPGATRTPVANHWWLDVETANSWRPDVSLNAAALQGGANYLASVGAASVGFYSAPFMWADIVGATSAFADYPSWVAGATTLQGAQSRCAGDGFTGGGVVLAQYLAKGFDANYRC